MESSLCFRHTPIAIKTHCQEFFALNILGTHTISKIRGTFVSIVLFDTAGYAFLCASILQHTDREDNQRLNSGKVGISKYDLSHDAMGCCHTGYPSNSPYTKTLLLSAYYESWCNINILVCRVRFHMSLPEVASMMHINVQIQSPDTVSLRCSPKQLMLMYALVMAHFTNYECKVSAYWIDEKQVFEKGENPTTCLLWFKLKWTIKHWLAIRHLKMSCITRILV